MTQQNNKNTHYLLTLTYAFLLTFLPLSPIQAAIKASDSTTTKLALIKNQFDQGQLSQVLQNIQQHGLQNEPQSQYMLAMIYRATPDNPLTPVQIATLFQNACDGNYVAAYQHCATNHIEGIAHLQDFAKARTYLEKAKKAGQADAIYLYAVLLLQGTVFPLDRQKAYHLLNQSAKQGHPLSQYALANLYHSGLGVDKDPKKAYEWYHEAAKNKVIDALIMLGQIHETGQDGSKKDLKIAHQFYNLATSLSSAVGRKKVITLTSTMKLKDVLEAQRSAKKWRTLYWDKPK